MYSSTQPVQGLATSCVAVWLEGRGDRPGLDGAGGEARRTPVRQRPELAAQVRAGVEVVADEQITDRQQRGAA